MSLKRESIGGYLGIHSNKTFEEYHKGCLKLHSARACLYLFLTYSQCKRIHLPTYYCDVIDDVIKCLDIEVVYYDIGVNFTYPKKIKTSDGDFVLIINYFGVNSKNIESFLELNDRSKIIIDNAQGLFSKVRDCAANIYSPRKFMGILDGGYLYSVDGIQEPEERYHPNHIEHILLDFANQQSLGYKSYLRSEEQLSKEITPKKISYLSTFLCQLNNYELIKEIRIRNFNLLAEVFDEENLLDLYLSDDDVPLCYPLQLNIDVEDMCSLLASKSIFIPRYWPSDRFENELFKNTLFLPVDQRLSNNELSSLITSVKDVIYD